MSEITWIQCQEIGCPNGLGVWHRHAPNFLDRWLCTEHDTAEVPA